MNISQNVEILNLIYQGCHIAINAIHELMQKVDSEFLQNDLKNLSDEHYKVAYHAECELHNFGQEPIDLSPLEKVGMWSSVHLNTFLNSTDNHLAELVLDGSVMAIKEITKKLNEYQCVQPNVHTLADIFIDIQTRHINIMKKYL